MKAGKYYQIALKCIFLIDPDSVVAKFDVENRILKV